LVGNQNALFKQKNSEKAPIGPILCVCFTNHALDQFLGGMRGEGRGEERREGGGRRGEEKRRRRREGVKLV
jgi:hypothetical protein